MDTEGKIMTHPRLKFVIISLIALSVCLTDGLLVSRPSEEFTLRTEADTLLSGAFVWDDITVPEDFMPGDVTISNELALKWDAPLIVARRTEDGDTLKAAFLSADGDTLALLIIARNVFIIK